MNSVILYIATSEDDFIADKEGGVDWLPHPTNDHDLEMVGYPQLMACIDTILMGSHSFKQVRGFGDWAWTDKHTYVFSAQSLDVSVPCITVTKDSPREFMHKINNRNSNKDIWLLGGSKLAKSFAQDNLIDKIILTLIPKKLGDGIPLGLSFDKFDLKNKQPLMDGMFQRTYLRKER